MTITGRKAVFWAWSVLAAIFAHALIPHADPVARTNGSAFSSTTSDVGVLRGAQAGDVVKRRQALPADPPAALIALTPVFAPAAARPAAPWLARAEMPVLHDRPHVLPPVRGPPTLS